MRWVLVLLAACHAAAPTPAPSPAPAPIHPIVHAEPPKLRAEAPPELAPEAEPILTSDGTPAALVGQVVDRQTGEPVIGATVAATVDGVTETTITDEDGNYALAVPPGHAALAFYYGHGMSTATAEVGDDVVAVDGEVGDSIAIDKNYIKNIPVPGRTFEVALGAALDASGEGPSFSSHCGLENVYIVDGEPVPTRTFDAVVGAAAGQQGFDGGE